MNVPGARSSAATWTDKKGDFWLFGGLGFDSAGNYGALNDLWEFNPTSDQWTWVNGSTAACYGATNNCSALPVYGTLGVPNTTNVPGARTPGATWTDGSGNFWLFGGSGIDSAGKSGNLNDLWEFNPSTNLWTWMGGSDIEGQSAVFGTQGTPSAQNIPEGWAGGAAWVDKAGHFWMFRGELWEFNPSTGQWTWMGGTTNDNPVYGALGVPAVGNTPGMRFAASTWTDGNGDLWLFGGAKTGYNSTISYDDLWMLNPATVQWVWMGGSSDTGLAGGGSPPTLGVFASTYAPQVRDSAASWIDSKGYVWLFGGEDNSNFHYYSDLWAFEPVTNEWAWMGSGSSCVYYGCAGTYGAQGIPAAGNIPGSRADAATWVDNNGNLWLFGGVGFGTLDDPNWLPYTSYELNDLWRYQASATSLPPVPPPQFRSEATSSSALSVTISDAVQGSTIYYTVDGSTPTTGSPQYNGPLTVNSAETINAIATASGYPPSGVASYAITHVGSTFTLSASPASLIIQPGTQGTTKLTVTPWNDFASSVSFACSGLPSGTTCSFSPSTVSLQLVGASVSTQLTVTAVGVQAAIHRDPNPYLPGTALGAVICLFGWRRRRALRLLLPFAVIATVATIVSGCGGGSTTVSTRTSPTTATVTVIATSGSIQQTTNISLTIN